MTLREQVAMRLGDYMSVEVWKRDTQYARDYWLEIADAALSIITEACAKVADEMEREEHDAVGHPLLSTFEPRIGPRIRELAKS